jgi:uncharacterized protein (TIGR03067 family)
MRIQVGLVLVTGLVIESVGPTRGEEKKGAKGLEGTWVVVSATREGKEPEGVRGNKVVFSGNSVTVHTKNGELKATFKTDPKKKTIDITVAEQGQKEVMKGVYKINGDELKVCHSRPGQGRPKDFTAEKGSGNTLIVLKRTKDKGHKNGTKLASVEGTVTLDGQPLPMAKVEFVPPDKGGRRARGTTDEDGKYKLVTAGKEEGILAGPYKVVITKKVAGKSVLPAKYGSPDTTPLRFTVKQGRNTLNIELTR